MALFVCLCPSFSEPLRLEIRKSSDHQTPISVWQVNHEEIKSIIERDLDCSGAFHVLDKNCAVDDGLSAFLVMAHIDHQGDQWKARIRLKKTDSEQEDITIDSVCAPHMRTLGHRISNAIHKAIVGQLGHFEQRIVYRAECGPTSSKRLFRLATCDSDGKNGSFLTSRHMDIRTLCSDRRSCRIAYVGYKGGCTHLFIVDAQHNKKYKVPLGGGGIPIAPRFSPCGKKLIFSLAKDGVTSLYQYTFGDQRIQMCVDKGLCIDVSPSYAPDGRSFVFVSDRMGGRPRLYVKNPGQDPVLLSKKGGSYFSPSWSPDGQWIVFVKRKPDGYYLGIMASDGTQERLIARDHVIDGPAWASNSRVILFSAQQKSFGPFSLFTIDRTGRTLRKVAPEVNGQRHGCASPFWGNAP